MFSLLRRWLPLLVIIAVAAVLRCANIGAQPPGLYRDEGFYGLDALNVLRGHLSLYFAANNGREGLFIYLLAPAIALLGRTPEALRMVSAVIGTLTVLAVYFAGRNLFSHRVGVLSAAVMAVTFWHIALSRVAFRAITLPLLLCITVALTAGAIRRDVSGSRRGAPWLAGAAGLAFGLTFYTYTSGQFVAAVLVAFAAFVALTPALRASFKISRAAWMGFALGSAVALAPLSVWLVRHADLYFIRADQVSILSPIINRGDFLGTLAGNIAKAVGMFGYQGDRIWRHNLSLRPVFTDWMILAFFGGVTVSVGRLLRAQSTERRTQSTEHRTQSTEHRTQNTERRTQSTEHRTQSTERRTQSTEHRTQNTEHRTESTERRTQSTEHRTQNTEHRTESTERRTQNTEHRTQNGEHRTESTEHRAQSGGHSAAGALLVLLWLVVFLIPTILAEDTPHFLRAIGALPAACILIALGLEAVLIWMSRRGWLNFHLGPLRRWISPPAALAAFALAVSAVSVAGDYFNTYVNQPMTRFWLEDHNVQLARTINAFASTHAPGGVWLQQRLADDNPSLRFLSPPVESGQVSLVEAGRPGASGTDIVLLVDPNHDWTGLRDTLPRGSALTVEPGPMAQGDLDPAPRRAFLAVHARPVEASAVRAYFEQGILLEGAGIAPSVSQVGSVYTVTLNWSATRPISEDYAVFVHWVRDEALIAQHDGSPADGYLPMPAWRTGDVIVDEHRLAVPSGFQPGDQVRVGLYRRGENKRLNVLDASGAALGEWVDITATLAPK